MALSGWTALVHFATDETKVVTVFETPTDGVELVGLPEGWIARDVKFREGEFEGKEFQLELQAERSE
jgi:hypothetical protein